MPTVRLAERRDIPAIVAMGLAFIRSTVYADVLTENPDQMASLASALIEGAADGVLLVAAEGDAKPVGMIGGLRFANPLSGDVFAQELFWWVTPEARGTLGGRLKVAFSRWAKDSGAIAAIWSAPTPDVDALYAKRGFLRVETSFMERF